MRNISSRALGKRYMGTCILHMILYLSVDTVSLPTWSAEQKNKVFSGVRSAIFLFQSGLSEGMHNFLKVSDFRKCSSFPKYKFVMTTSTKNYEDECFIFFKKKEHNIKKPSQILFFGTFDIIHQSDVTFF